MVSHMKTTVEISRALLAKARRLAACEGTTVRALIEAGLRKEVSDRKARDSFRLRRATFGGQGLREDLARATWEQIRDLAYRRRG